MASRVNTRFVIILIVGVIAILGMLMLAYSVAYKSADDLALRGDEYMTAGEYKLAELAYSKAVNKDTTNSEHLLKWIQAMEMSVPSTQTEYRDRFNRDFIGATHKRAMILRNDIDAHERFLDIRYQMLKAGYSRGMADALINDTSSALAFFNSDPERVQEWERLKRYRALGILRIAQRVGELEEDQLPLALDDFERAIIADENDIESIVGLMYLKLVIAQNESDIDDSETRIAVLNENLQAAEAFLETHPGNIEMELQKIRIGFSRDLSSLSESLSLDERSNILDEIRVRYAGALEQTTQQLMGSSSDQVSLHVIDLYTELEFRLLQDLKLENTRTLIDALIETDNENARVFWAAALAAERAKEFDEALGWHARIGDLETRPLSYEGLRQYRYQVSALRSQASIKVDQAIDLTRNNGSQEQIDAAINEAEAYRDQYASSIADDDTSLLLLDGMISQARGATAEALSMFKKYNELSVQRPNPDGFFREGMSALLLRQYGVARSAFEEQIVIDNDITRLVTAKLALAQIESQLNNYEAASQYYQSILADFPRFEEAIEGLARITMVLNPELHDDPIESDILVSRQIRLGTDDTPGDAAGAIEFLYESVETHDYDPRVVSELVQLLFENKNIDSARSLLVKSQERHPDDESIGANLALFDSDDIVEIQIALIERSTKMSDVDKLISISRVAAENGRKDLWDESVRELNSLASNDDRVRELTFVHAITFGDFETAERIADNSNNKQIESLNFKARIAMIKDQPRLAIEFLEQATATGAADSDSYRMLASLYRDTGRFQDAVQFYEQALAIRPDNAQAITEYITTLVSAGKYEDALNIGRRLQQHASSNPTFMNLWLTLEASYGGDQGHDFAIRQRQQMLELNPSNFENKFQLTRMYITSKEWNTARALIDQLRAESDHILLVQLDATWYADQGMIKAQSGLVLANKVFADYIATLPEPVDSEPYIANAQFMLDRGRPDLAIAAANQAVAAQSPETMLGSKLLGRIYSQINNHSQAVKSYQAVIESDADSNFEVHQLLINSLTRLERYDEAQEIHSEFPEEFKTQIVTMLYEADIAFGLGDDARANTILNDVVSRYPNNPFGYIKRAQSMIGDETLFNDLLSDTSRAISLAPNNSQSYLVRAEGNFAIDRQGDGLKDLRTAIRLNPRLDNSIYSILNVLLTQPGRSSEAMDVAREVIDRRPEDSTLMTRIGGLFSARKEWKKAAEIYGMAWDKNPSVSNGALYIDALVRMSPPDAETANGVIKALEKVLGNINEIPDLLAAQALVLQARGLNDFALQQITKAFILSVNEDDKITHWANNLSRFFENEPVGAQARYLLAIKGRNSPEVQNPDVQAWIDYFIARHLVKAEEIDPFAFTTLNRLKDYTNNPRIQVQAYRTHGSTLYSQKKFVQAAEVWKSGLEHFSDDWEMNNNLAYVLSRELDQAQEALPYGQAAIDKNIAQSEAYETMAGIYISLKKYDEAEQMIETGSKFIRTAKARITMTLSSGRLELARGNMIEARSRFNDCRSMLRSSPTAYSDLEEDIAAFEQEIKSADG